MLISVKSGGFSPDGTSAAIPAADSKKAGTRPAFLHFAPNVGGVEHFAAAWGHKVRENASLTKLPERVS
jgi:hypothetical protein